MFHQAKIKLTVWYLLIITLVSLFFSVLVYRSLTFELNRMEERERLRIEREIPNRPRPFTLSSEAIEETKHRILLTILVINLVVLGASSVAGFFLAGRTLTPIKKMVEEQDRFISDASHELRTPITALKSEIEVNLRDKKLTLIGAKKLLLSNLEETNNLQVLSDNLIKLSQYHHRQNTFVMTQVSLKTVVNLANKRVNLLAKNKNIQVVNQIKNVTLWGEEASLVELLVILLDNAIKYSPKNTQITLLSHRTDGHLILKVIDQGMGISRKDLPHIFDRFYRADKARSHQVAGYGLGLSIAQEIVKRHQGTIKAESQLGQGTVFSVSLQVGKVK